MKSEYRYKTAEASLKSKDKPQSSESQESMVGGVVIGKLVDIANDGTPKVAYDLDSSQAPVDALSVVPLSASLLGSEVVLSFAGNRDGQPVVMGVVQGRFDASAIEKNDGQPSVEGMDTEPELLVNGEKISIAAAKEITLKCGKSSITLKENGKILIKGEHILSRAKGANRVRGGSIQLN